MGRLRELSPGEKVVWLHQAAPAKPAAGAPCNGCGVCCAVEPCPVALVWLHQRHGACKALEWSEEAGRYHCGMAQHPARYVRWLPVWSHRYVRRLVLRWIAADTACDAADTADTLAGRI